MSKREKKVKKSLPPKKLFLKRFFLTFLIAIVVVSSGMAALAAFMNSTPMATFSKKQTDEDIVANFKTDEDLDILVPASGMFETDYKDSKRINVLFLGNTDEGLTDTIMLCSFDPESKKADIISVPRDTYYEREGYDGAWLKINSVAHEGPKATSEAINDVLLGIPINYYFMVDYDGVKNIVDAMDGVPMDVPQDMYYTNVSQNLYIDLQAGDQVLDGDHAIQFLRFRKGYFDGDLGRVHAQQEFLKSAAKRAIGINLPSVVKTVAENVDSLISIKAITYIASKAANMDFANINTYTLPGADSMIGGLSFFLRAENPEIETLLRAVYDGTEYPPPEDSTESEDDSLEEETGSDEYESAE